MTYDNWKPSWQDRLKNSVKLNTIFSRRNREMSFIEQAARSAIAGRPTFVVGSAPHADFSMLSEDMAVVTANGSLRSLKTIGLDKADLTVLDNELLNPITNSQKESRAVVIRERLLEECHLGDAFTVSSNGNIGGDIAQLGAEFSSVTPISRKMRSRILNSVGRCTLFDKSLESLVSTGMFAVALAVLGGAKYVVFSGFSLFKDPSIELEPHFYSEMGIGFDEGKKENLDATITFDTRAHSSADTAIVSLIQMSGYPIYTPDKDFKPMVQNFGNKKSK